MSKNIYRIITIFVSLLLCSSEVLATNKYDSTIPKIEEYVKNYNDYTIGVIEGEKYIVAHIDGGFSLVVSRVNANNTYEPIAYLNQDYFPFQLQSKIENNSIIMSGGQGHHGSYTIEYIFKSRNGVFYLSRFQETSNFGDDYHNPVIQINKVKTVDFNKSKIYMWERRFNLKNKSESIAWGNSMKKLGAEASMLGGKTRTTKFKSKLYLLEEFNFESFSSEIPS